MATPVGSDLSRDDMVEANLTSAASALESDYSAAQVTAPTAASMATTPLVASSEAPIAFTTPAKKSPITLDETLIKNMVLAVRSFNKDLEVVNSDELMNGDQTNDVLEN